MAGRGSRTPHEPHRRLRVYALRGVLPCGLCDRRMTGNWNNDQAYYRCRFPTEYALADRVDHPKTVYLREADVTGQLDPWLGHAFGPGSLDAGGDPTVIGPWIAETQAQKVAARAEIRSATGQRPMTRDEIAAIVTAFGDLVQVIRDHAGRPASTSSTSGARSVPAGMPTRRFPRGLIRRTRGWPDGCA